MSAGKRLVVLACLAASSLAAVRGQSPGDLNEGSRVEWDSANAIWRLKWWGRSGHTYFVQQSGDLIEPWDYLPIIESGNDSVREWGLTSNVTQLFVRLRHTDIPTNDPAGDDFDGDGLSNMQELLFGSDPFSNVDSDNNGLPDDWEMHYFGGLGNASGSDPDGDGLSNAEELALGSDPEADDLTGGLSARSYTYDAAGRLQQVAGGPVAESIGLDAESNITSQ